MLKENRTLGGELRNQLVATVTEMLEKDDRISAVADVLAKNGAGVPLLKLGATEIFGQVGMVDLLKEAYKLTAKDAVAEILKAWHKVN